jgi:hypothetical protein
LENVSRFGNNDPEVEGRGGCEEKKERKLVEAQGEKGRHRNVDQKENTMSDDTQTASVFSCNLYQPCLDT